ncbi:general stress protein, partial [Bhargavaea cecembensis]
MAERRVVGYYDTEQQAIDAIEDLKRQGYRSEDISVISQNNDQVDAIADETGTKAAEGAATGAATGGVLG